MRDRAVLANDRMQYNRALDVRLFGKRRILGFDLMLQEALGNALRYAHPLQLDFGYSYG